MAAIATSIDRVTKTEVVNVPVGVGLMMTVAAGTADALKATLAAWTGIEPLWWGLMLAFGLPNVKMIPRTLGKVTTDLASAVILADTLNDQLDVQNKVANFWAGLFGTSVTSASPPVLGRAGAVPAARAGEYDPYAGTGLS